MDSDLIATLITAAVTALFGAGGVGVYALRMLSRWLDMKDGAGWDVLTRLVTEIDDYIEDAAVIATGDLAAFRRPESEGGVAVTDDELQIYSRAIARKLLDGAGEPWMQRLMDLFGSRDRNDLQASVARKVVRRIREREDFTRAHPPKAA